MFTYFFTVVTKSEDAAKVDHYLYDHTAVISRRVDDRGRTHLLMQTTSVQSSARVRYLADYQAARLASGLFGVSSVSPLEVTAVTEHALKFGVDLTKN
jgi:hypothetical protein